MKDWLSDSGEYFGWMDRGTLELSRASQAKLARENNERLHKD